MFKRDVKTSPGFVVTFEQLIAKKGRPGWLRFVKACILEISLKTIVKACICSNCSKKFVKLCIFISTHISNINKLTSRVSELPSRLRSTLAAGLCSHPVTFLAILAYCIHTSSSM